MIHQIWFAAKIKTYLVLEWIINTYIKNCILKLYSDHHRSLISREGLYVLNPVSNEKQKNQNHI